MYKSEHSGENNSVIEIPLIDDTKEKKGNTYPPLKSPAATEKTVHCGAFF